MLCGEGEDSRVRRPGPLARPPTPRRGPLTQRVVLLEHPLHGRAVRRAGESGLSSSSSSSAAATAPLRTGGGTSADAPRARPPPRRLVGRAARPSLWRRTAAWPGWKWRRAATGDAGGSGCAPWRRWGCCCWARSPTCRPCWWPTGATVGSAEGAPRAGLPLARPVSLALGSPRRLLALAEQLRRAAQRPLPARGAPCRADGGRRRAGGLELLHRLQSPAGRPPARPARLGTAGVAGLGRCRRGGDRSPRGNAPLARVGLPVVAWQRATVQGA